jgi:hypothetical protein
VSCQCQIRPPPHCSHVRGGRAHLAATVPQSSLAACHVRGGRGPRCSLPHRLLGLCRWSAPMATWRGGVHGVAAAARVWPPPRVKATRVFLYETSPHGKQQQALCQRTVKKSGFSYPCVLQIVCYHCLQFLQILCDHCLQFLRKKRKVACNLVGQ